MAKKKKSARRKKVAPVVAERSPFWELAGGTGLLLLALLLLLGGFGVGGLLPVKLFNGFYWTLGWAAYLAPVALAYWGIYKLTSEERRLPLGRVIGLAVVLLFASTWSYTALATKNAAGNWGGDYGGAVGKGIGNVALSVLDKVPAALLFFVLTALAIFFAFGIPPRLLLKLVKLFKRPERSGEDSELAALKSPGRRATGL